jgi:hypothetical protein
MVATSTDMKMSRLADARCPEAEPATADVILEDMR